MTTMRVYEFHECELDTGERDHWKLVGFERRFVCIRRTAKDLALCPRDMAGRHELWFPIVKSKRTADPGRWWTADDGRRRTSGPSKSFTLVSVLVTMPGDDRARHVAHTLLTAVHAVVTDRAVMLHNANMYEMPGVNEYSISRVSISRTNDAGNEGKECCPSSY